MWAIERNDWPVVLTLYLYPFLWAYAHLWWQNSSCWVGGKDDEIVRVEHVEKMMKFRTIGCYRKFPRLGLIITTRHRCTDNLTLAFYETSERPLEFSYTLQRIFQFQGQCRRQLFDSRALWTEVGACHSYDSLTVLFVATLLMLVGFSYTLHFIISRTLFRCSLCSLLGFTMHY